MNMVDAAMDFFRHNEVMYILLIFLIFVVPKVLQRLRIPPAITAFALGMAAGPGLQIFQGDETIKLLATLGIVTLFLHAGLDINIVELRKNKTILVQHSLLFVLLLAVTAGILILVVDISVRLALLVALAIVTPSTGFILDSIKTIALSEEEKEWICSKAISAELVALVFLFFTMQSLSADTLLVSLATVLTLTMLIPFLFRVFAKRIAPFAPDSEFAFLIMLATICAFVTRKIGAYYLLGAFIVGVAARRFQQELPTITSERLIGAVELFASFFVPFYFFYSGSLLTRDNFSSSTWVTAGILLVVFVPLRLLWVVVHRHLVLGESLRKGMRVAVPMVPTLVFTLVIAQLAQENFSIDGALYSGLAIYAICNSLMVSVVMKNPEPDVAAEMLKDGLMQLRKDGSK